MVLKHEHSSLEWGPTSFAAVSWLNPLLALGARKPLTEEDLPGLNKKERASASRHWLDEYCLQTHATSESNKKSLLTAFLPFVLPIVVADAACKLVSTILSVCLSLMIQQVLIWIGGGSTFLNNGSLLAAIMLAMQLTTAVANTVAGSLGIILQTRVKSALSSAIYCKSLALSSKARKDFPPGKINSLISADVASLLEYIDYINKLWSIPLQIVLSLYFVSRLLGPATGVAAGVFLGLSTASGILSPRVAQFFKGYMKALDKRTTILREFLYGVKVVKYHAWEDYSLQKIQQARKEQVKALYKIIYGFMLIISLMLIQQSLTSPLTFIAYGALGNTLKAETVFPALSFLTNLMTLAGEISQILFSIAQCRIAYKRMSDFLVAEEAAKEDVPEAKNANESEDAIVLINASFSWESVKVEGAGPNAPLDDDIFKLNGVSVCVKRGTLVAVVGATGSGKSSFLSAITGGMRKTGGQATIYGSVAYAAQDPWIISGTIEENITLLDDTITSRVPYAVEVCALNKDLNSFPSGVKTQIGEKGINLSGGQKARIALARTISKNPDIYVLDDPLSALDAHVSKAIFDGAIRGDAMRGKTIVLATHFLHVLQSMDQVLVMDKGKIVQNGTFQELMQDERGRLFDIMKDYHLDELEMSNPVTSEQKIQEKGIDMNAKVDKSEAEDRVTGAVSNSTYLSFVKAIGYGYFFFETFVFLIMVGGYVASQLTLTSWTSNNWNFSNERTYLYIFTGTSLVTTVADVASFAFILLLCVRASQHFHDSAMLGLIRAPMSFFDQQPIGRILNRMTADVRQTDRGLGFSLTNLLACLYPTLGMLILTCVSSWPLIPLCAILIAAIYVVFRYFRGSYRELRRLNSVMASPFAAHVSETLTGIPTILAYNADGVFIAKQAFFLDQANTATFLYQHTTIWVALRLDILGAGITFAVMMLGVTGLMSASFVGLALTQVVALSPMVQAVLVLIAAVEANMVAVERLNHYAQNLPSERASVLPSDASLPSDWPNTGAIEIQDLVLRYITRPEYAVIKGVSVTIQAGEKVGVVGRTGSGKSTLADSLFRLLEASSGAIIIDGVNIASLGLKKLRSSLQMIPQTPTMFEGTLRSNLDALGKYDDEAIWRALERVGMKEYAAGLSEGLDSKVTEGGTNLSAGQRQLLCLAVVLLERSKILVMDEATSSVDAESDLRVQDVLRTYFKEATVISIAHRLNTIAAFDKALVLQDGRVAEYDAPHVLLQKEGSVFREMVDATGAANAVVISDIAKRHYERIQ
ncbi:P-loop containing nucleoside triphosphate hydrolase protein [Chytriomyces sp. MP71]|nr:P-loop containing nucleoside triphosphate hydrolase protein [Chytriomyces sp. MP71]